MASKRSSRRDSARRRLPLSVRLSLLVLFAAIVPLAAVVGINDYFARGTLIDQGRSALTTDAQAKMSLVDTYMHERLLDGQALASLPTAPAYLACIAATQLPDAQAAALDAKLNCLDPQLGLAFYQGSNQRALCVGLVRDTNYTTWSIYTARGQALLSFGQHDPNAQCPENHSGLSVPKEDLQQVQQGKPFVSAVYKSGDSAYVNLYTPIAVPLLDPQKPTVLGFLQARLKLDYIWNIVNHENGANGAGSYAFITDANGVRIASSKPEELFTAVAPLDSATQQLITSEQRYGSGKTVPVSNLPGVAASLKSTAPEENFQAPAVPGSNTEYQYVRDHLTNVSWTYFVLSPLSTVTAVADEQVRLSLLSAGVIAVLAILIGLLLGRNTARPVQAATEELQGAAGALKALATRQQSSAGEQQWVVDACKTGLDSVRYLADAMNQAARRIIDASNWFGEYWDRLTEEQARRTVQHLQELARYIDEAAHRQNVSSERLGKAITVTTQVSDQLVAGATAAKRSADQLDEVVGNLRHVVGGRPPEPSPELDQDDESDELMSRVGVQPPAPVRAARSGRLAMPGPQMPGPQRQLPAPVSAPEMVGAGYAQMSPRSQVFGGDQWPSGGGRAPQAPYGPYASARRPGQSQLFDGGPGSYPGSDFGGSGGNGGYGYDNGGGYGGQGGYGADQGGRRGGSPSRYEWDR